METVIKAKNLGKKYDISHLKGGYISLREILSNVFSHPIQFVNHKIKKAAGLVKKEEFWALKNIDFEIQKGEIVGIIGANGAGKSTLLKILSQITTPTEGEIEINGRVGSLLEVGTGFNPELTGRENIFLNGAILGMSKKEIAEKFNRIVEFSGVEKFLDTPVKRYSSGMYVRLAFAVAAHLEPDILIVDEVLAVGDAEFQKKCLGKMDEITKKEGRTILFVSHNMAAIGRLCQRTILLENGQIKLIGETANVLSVYLNQNRENNYFQIAPEQKAAITSFGYENFEFKFEIIAKQELNDMEVAIGINDATGNRITTLFSRFSNVKFNLHQGKNLIICQPENFYLKSGIYQASLFLGNKYDVIDFKDKLASFKVESFDFYTDNQQPDASQGNILVKQNWLKIN